MPRTTRAARKAAAESADGNPNPPPAASPEKEPAPPAAEPPAADKIDGDKIDNGDVKMEDNTDVPMEDAGAPTAAAAATADSNDTAKTKTAAAVKTEEDAAEAAAPPATSEGAAGGAPPDIAGGGTAANPASKPEEHSVAATAGKLTHTAPAIPPPAAVPSANGTTGAGDKKKEGRAGGGGPSFSMTLAIGPDDARRAVQASRAFDAAVKKLQRADEAAAKGETAEEEGEGGMEEVGGDGGEKGEGGKEEGGAGGGSGQKVRKRKPAIVHSPHGTMGTLQAPAADKSDAAGEAAQESPVHSPKDSPGDPPKGAAAPAETDPPPPPRPLRELLLPAAQSTADPLIASFLGRMAQLQMGEDAQRAALVFFLDADKSTKLLAAFDVLGNAGGGDGGKEGEEEKGEEKGEGDATTEGGTNAGEEETAKGTAAPPNNDDAIAAPAVAREGLVTLFESFLTSISTCVHGEGRREGRSPKRVQIAAPEEKRGEPEEGNKEGDAGKGGDTGKGGDAAGKGGDTGKGGDAAGKGGDWTGSDRTQREIREVAAFAAENLAEYARKEGKTADGATKGDEDNEKKKGETAEAGVTFDTFGRWYNSGGFSLVPWLELLDLSKWDGAGTANSANASRSSSASSSSKRKASQLTPAATDMAEPLGSPTELFERGASLIATPQTPHGVGSGGDGNGGVQSFAAMFGQRTDSRTVVSFDFSGSAPDRPGGGAASFHINITEENLVMLRSLVRRTGFATLQPRQAEALMLRHARCERRGNGGEAAYVITRAQFGKFVREAVPKEASKRFDPGEVENFSNYFTNFFTCFDYGWSELQKDEANAKELMVGFSFLFAGNKSAKLAAAYEMLDVDRKGYLTQQGLMRYLRSYLTMLAGISLLSANKKTTTQIRKRLMSSRRDDAFLAVENGARWTLSHFVRAHEARHARQRGSTRSNAITFEDFARWYTEGGYAVAPWLELLDLQKFLSLIGDTGGKYREANDPTLSEVLFTFPLTNDRNLVVLRDDAQYVKTVVNELGLLSLTSEDIWRILYPDMAKIGGKAGSKKTVSMEVDQPTFVQAMMRILSGTGQMKQHSSWNDLSPEETLKNFFLSFDLSESNKVPLNQLMCGLTLLCGGKKSNKLVFAFGLFAVDEAGKNGKKKASMAHGDFFFFFRSFLIVMFSCCNQSLSLNAAQVTQYISDTATAVADDVMAYWKAKKVERVKFEHFSEWYNEGGFETAPWLELLDLNKWVLADQTPASQQVPTTPGQRVAGASSHTPGLTPGHEAIKALLASPKVKGNGTSPGDVLADDPLFDLDMSAVDAEVDEMDFILQQESSTSQGHAENAHFAEAAPAGGAQSAKKAAPPAAPAAEPQQNALKFNLLTHDQFGGYMISIGPDQVQLLQRIVTETGLFQIDAPVICKFILFDKSRRIANLSKKAFQSAMKRVFDHASKSLAAPVPKPTQDELSKFTDKLFASFDRPKTGKINALELACGFTALCGGRKSDKLEHVFELLDEDKDSLVSRQDITRFIQSFLVMLMSVSSSFTHLYGGACSNDGATVSKAVKAGAEWATAQVFEALKPKNDAICFDDFADWYTKGGYQSMPWLELLDLRKWVIQES